MDRVTLTQTDDARARDIKRNNQCHVGVLNLCCLNQDLVLMLSEAEAQLENDRTKAAHFVSEALQLPEALHRR